MKHPALHRTTLVKDLAAIALLVLGFFAAASHLELFEKVTRAARGYEHWQLDEVPLTLLVLSLGLAWFGWRRVREAHREIGERIRAQQQVAALLSHNRDLAQRLIVVQENERRALARELHDEVGQHCTAMRAEARYIQHAQVPEPIGASAQRIGESAEILYGLVKGMLSRLRPPALDSLGIESALQELCETWEQHSGIACVFVPQGPLAALSDTTSVTLYRLMQEALTNVARHAKASHVRIHLGPAKRQGWVSLHMEDNGCGLHASTLGEHGEVRARGFGLLGMRERVAAMDGLIHFDSAPGHSGLRIQIELPLEAPAP